MVFRADGLGLNRADSEMRLTGRSTGGQRVRNESVLGRIGKRPGENGESTKNGRERKTLEPSGANPSAPTTLIWWAESRVPIAHLSSCRIKGSVGSADLTEADRFVAAGLCCRGGDAESSPFAHGSSSFVSTGFRARRLRGASRGE
jgi:hypothetical protein